MELRYYCCTPHITLQQSHSGTSHTRCRIDICSNYVLSPTARQSLRVANQRFEKSCKTNCWEKMVYVVRRRGGPLCGAELAGLSGTGERLERCGARRQAVQCGGCPLLRCGNRFSYNCTALQDTMRYFTTTPHTQHTQPAPPHTNHLTTSS